MFVYLVSHTVYTAVETEAETPGPINGRQHADAANSLLSYMTEFSSWCTSAFHPPKTFYHVTHAYRAHT